MGIIVSKFALTGAQSLSLSMSRISVMAMASVGPGPQMWRAWVFHAAPGEVGPGQEGAQGGAALLHDNLSPSSLMILAMPLTSQP